MLKKKSIGKIVIPAGMRPEEHELETAYLLVENGFDITFIKPSMTKGVRTPDVEIDGVKWEIKCPTGKSKWTIDRRLKEAVHQSANVIFDTRRIKIPAKTTLDKAQETFKLRKSLKRMLLITKDNHIIDLKK